MKFEFKTENENFLKSFSNVLGFFFSLALLIILCDVVIRLRIISRNYQVEYNCKLLSVKKSTNSFKKLTRLSNLKSKQIIWEFCREFVK